MNTRKLRLTLPIILLLTGTATLRAQFVDWPPVPQVWDIFQFDSSFVLGAHTIYDPDSAMSALHMTFSQDYQNSAASIKQKMATPETVFDSLSSYRYIRSNQIGFKFIVLLDNLPTWVYDAKSADAWFDKVNDNQIQILNFKSKLNPNWYDPGIWRTRIYKEFDPNVPQKFFYYLEVTARDTTAPADTATTVLMAGDARFMQQVLAQSGLDKWDKLFHIWTDPLGVPRDSATADSLAALYDRSKIFDVSVAIRADASQITNQNVDSLDAIGYLHVFVRDTALQARSTTPITLDSLWVHDSTYREAYYGGDSVERFAGHWKDTSVVDTPVESCRCAIYRPLSFDTITKLDYLHAAALQTRQAGDDFVEVSTEVDPSPYIPIEYDVYWKFEDNPKFFGWSSGDERARSYCAWMLDYRMNLSSSDPLWLPPGSIIRHQRAENPSYLHYPSSVEDADLIYRFYTTRRVDLSFVRGRISNRLTTLVDEGMADSLIVNDYLSFYTDDTVNPMLNRIGIADEVGHRRYRSFTHVNSVVQSAMRDSGDTRGVWFNPPTNPDLNRVATGDFDSLRTFEGDTNMKAMHMAARQAYKLGMGDPVPVTYINPDLMSDYAVDTTFGARLIDEIDSVFDKDGNLIRIDTTALRSITRTAEWDYRKYTDRVQNEILGSYHDRGDIQSALHGGGQIPSLARHVQASRFDYRDISEYSHPVLNVVQTHGFYHHSDNSYKKGGFGTRQPTPEEILVMAWASLACNVNGLIFGDFQDDGTTIGIMRGVGDTAVADEYGDLYHSNWWAVNDTIPGMWLGRKSRYEAVREVTTDIYHIDTLIGWRNLLYEQDQMSLYDSRASFAAMPMLDTVRAERAARHNFSYAGGTWTFNPSDTFDAREETYMEVSQFYPSTADSAAAENDVRYLLFVNRLTYPIDTNTYSVGAVAQLDANATYTGTSSTTGFGAIDVRRPVVVLKNSTATPADSLIVEKISVHGTWIDTVAVGDELELDWLRPGRGAFYRLTPIPIPVSPASTAYNNAVRAENTSTDEVEGERLVVYERDSAIWLRRFHSTTGWSGEHLISSALDTVRNTSLGTYTAFATTPALATARDDSATLIVWQRKDAATLAGTVEGLWVPGPPSAANLANGLSFTFSSARTLNAPWKIMTPAVVGIDGGWAVAWGSPGNGIEVTSLRNSSSPTAVDDLSAVATLKAGSARFNPTLPLVPLDPISKFPTLGYVSNADSNGHHHVHVAWQQGQDTLLGGFVPGPFIMYTEFTVNFSGTGEPTIPGIGPVEHVSYGLPGCQFLHPSIAVDSTRIGVAFESHMIMLSPGWPFSYPLGQISTVTLRFRDSLYTPGGGGARPWITTPYYWGDDTTRNVYPSLTQFPSRQRDSLLFDPAGALVWFDENSTSDHGRTAQQLYRFGDKGSVDLPPGIFPTMMSAPGISTPPLGGTGIFYRGDTATAFTRENDWAEDRTYFTPHLLMEETGGGFTGAFAAVPKGRGIFAGYTLGNWYHVEDGCDFEAVTAGILHDFPDDDLLDDGFVDSLPPDFFGISSGGETWIDSVDDVVGIARTGAFPASASSTQIHVYVGRSSDITSWLDSWPYDSTLGSQADVKIIPELVRDVDTAILWQSNTISARDMTADYLDLNLTVPVDQYTNVGELVYVRLRAIPTAGLGYTASTGFHFFDGLPVAPAAKYAPLPNTEVESDDGAAGLHLSVVPNPAGKRVEVRCTVARAGRIDLTLFSLLGEEIRPLPTLHAERSGRYSIEVNLENLRSGTYLIRGRTPTGFVSEQFVVRR